MVPELRRRHRFTWLLFAFLLPALFVGSILVIPDEPAPINWQDDVAIAALPQIKNSYSTANMAFRLRTDGARYQVEVELKQPLDVPSAVIYLFDMPVGQLNSMGIYRFPILEPEENLPVKLMDGIKQKELLSFDLLQTR